MVTVFWSTLTFCALFYLIGAFFRRPAVLALVYAFFLEVIIGNMPGTRLYTAAVSAANIHDQPAADGVNTDTTITLATTANERVEVDPTWITPAALAGALTDCVTVMALTVDGRSVAGSIAAGGEWER